MYIEQDLEKASLLARDLAVTGLEKAKKARAEDAKEFKMRALLRQNKVSTELNA
jgi:hypothetical protein